MSISKYILVFVLTICSAIVYAQKSSKWLVSPNSNLIVNGSTNMAGFSCIIPNFPKADTIKVFPGADPTKKVALTGSIRLPVLAFDCKNSWMTKELRKTLKQPEFPYLVVRFISLEAMPDADKKNNTLKGVVEIEIAGVKKLFEITYQLIIDSSNTIYLSVIKDVNFTDFKITPPSKMGVVKTRDKLTVEISMAVYGVK